MHDWLRWPKAWWRCIGCLATGKNVCDPSWPKFQDGYYKLVCGKCQHKKKRAKVSKSHPWLPGMGKDEK